jgi:hypothetical protein
VCLRFCDFVPFHFLLLVAPETITSNFVQTARVL